MTSLTAIPDCITGAGDLVALASLGFAVGAATGLFGVGGAFLITPILNIFFGVPYTLATGSAMPFTIGTSVSAWARHMRMGNVAVKTMTILAGGAVCGTILGGKLHIFLKNWSGPVVFTLIMHSLFIILLAVSAILVWRGNSAQNSARALLARCPGRPRITIRAANLTDISLPGLCLLGLFIGVIAGLLGIGGGVFLMPAMLIFVGLTVRQSVGTGLGIIFLNAAAGTVFYGLKGQASFWIVMPLLVGSSIGVQLGAWALERLQGARIRKYFALLVLAVLGIIAADLAGKLSALYY